MSQWNLKQRVLDTVAERPVTFSELLDASDGAYPLDIQECVSALVKEGLLEHTGSHYTAPQLPSTSTAPTGYNEFHEVELPPPHPLDYDWRFDEVSKDFLVSAILGTPPTRHVLLLGTPSLLSRLVRARPLVTSAVLLDTNSSLRRAFGGRLAPGFELIQHNLLTAPLLQPREPVSVVVVDPPWYFAHYAAFLAQAAFASRHGATVLLSLLPLNTRPDAPVERAAILNLAFSFGLQLRELRRNALRYISPPFEQAALNSQGVAVREDWRCGDLAVFDAGESLDRARLESIRAEAVEKDALRSVDLGWHEFEVFGQKVKIQGPFDDQDTPRLISIEEGDILPTVSRRYRGRKQIDLWLWDNRVFALQGKRAMFLALARLSGTLEAINGPSDEEKLRAAEKILLRLFGEQNIK